MGNPYQQKSLQRKVVYLALIAALFTVSLLHRKFVIEPQAENLQLREAARGDVELTSSFVRLSLTGSRGLATTILWSTAIDRMARHEWNELELLVNSISALQPYFVTPWLYQSWNLAFNVAVECDRPRDKYYYVSRGVELLAEGERRNRGTADLPGRSEGMAVFPGNPEMRHFVGFYYQLKIGNSDEKNTMRSLLELSCIDPLKRNPERFRVASGDQIDKQELQRFCQDHPRLVRRLRDQLGYESPKDVVDFLDKNRDVPTRFKKAVATDQKVSELEAPRKQFPVLPPVAPRPARPETGPKWPDPQLYELTDETVDIFLFCRTWYQYAQEPLPPPSADPGVFAKENEHRQELERKRKEENVNYRIPKGMATVIFRSYPARGQLFIAENLENEGWFDDEGWTVNGWFDQGGSDELRVGTETKYHAQPAWLEAYRMYMEYGIKNGLYLSPAEVAELERKAEPLRRELKLGPFDNVPPSAAVRARNPQAFDAAQKLFGSGRDRSMTNYDAHLYQSEAEMQPETIRARNLLYHAILYNRKNEHQALPLYNQVWPMWVQIGLRYPKFLEATFVQDDLYEPMLKYMRLTQQENAQLFRSVMLGAAQAGTWPHYWPPVDYKETKWRWVTSAQLEKALSLRVARGPLELIAYYNGPQREALRDYWWAWTAAPAMLGVGGFAPPVPSPDQRMLALAGTIHERRDVPPEGWRYFIEPGVVQQLRQRYGLLKPPPPNVPMTRSKMPAPKESAMPQSSK